MVKKKRPKKSAAWKKIMKAHKRGPKRVRMNKKTTTEDVDAIEFKKIQIIVENGWTLNYIVVCISETALQKLSLKKSITLSSRQAKRHGLYKTFYALDHNALVMGTETTVALRIDTYCGPYVCDVVVYGGRLRTPALTIHITNTREEEEDMRVSMAHVKSLFSTKVPRPTGVEVEYM